MSTPIRLPDLGSDSARISLWYVYPGETVVEGDRVVEVRIPGATFDVSAPISGTILDRFTLTNDPVTTGQTLGLIDPAGGA